MLGRFFSPISVELSGIYLEQKQNPRITILPFESCDVASAGGAAHCTPFLRHSHEEGGQLTHDDHAGVKEDAANNRESQQTGWGPAGVQLWAGASSPHQNGQQCHQANVQEQEL